MASAPAHEWTSREGARFFYKDENGDLIGVNDYGRLPQDQDFSGQLKKGDRAIAMDGRLFAALTPGSDVVRIVENRSGEQILRSVNNVPLSGDSVAAKAMRDSMAGLLTFPSEAALNAPAQTPSAAAAKPEVIKATSQSADPAYSAAYKHCMDAGDAAAGVTSAMADCTHEELAKQDARLNASYKVAMGAGNPAQQAQLRDAQRAWIKSRDAKCKEGLEGGTMDILTESDCHLSMTTARADELARMARPQ